MKKQKSKKVGIIGIVLSLILVVSIVVVDVLCITYQSMINLYFRKESATEVDLNAVEVKAQDVTTEINAEGTVLLKNESGLLPISGQVNLFGASSYQQLYLGTGSAGGWNWDADSCVNLKDALAGEGITVNPDLWQFYIDNYTQNDGQAGGVTNMTGASHNIVEQPLSAYGDSLLNACKSYSDTAIIVFARAGGEGSDAIMDMADASGGDAGKSYLELQNVELELLEYVKENFKNVIVLLNTPMPVECGWIDSADTGADTAGDVDAAMWIGLPGLTGNNGVAQVIAGKVSPSGRLADTWAYEVESAPSYYNFGNYIYTNGGDDSYNNKYVHYMEGIYVGYRWYETANAEGVQVSGVTNYTGESKNFDFGDYSAIVQYPFGYGLSYTTFSQEWDGDPSYDSSTKDITFKIKVSNTGAVASKTVVELYCEQPYTVGGIEKAKVVLVGYGKTSELAPGSSETVTITVGRDSLASYDYKTERCYVLDEGDYIFYSDLGGYGAHCWASNDGSVISNTQHFDRVLFNESNPRSTDRVAATNQFDDVTAGDGTYSEDDYMTRADLSGTFPKAYADSTATASDVVMQRIADSQRGAVIPEDSGSVSMPETGNTSKAVYCEDLIGKSYDDPLWDDLLDRLTVEEMVTLTASCGWQNPSIASIKKKACIDMDGAEGLHDLVNDTSLHMYNSSVVTASTWNTDLAYEMGSVYGDECVSQNVTGMYGFSMNTHRSPFGGRCFEYYSEDGLLAGSTAAAQTSGLQSKGIAVYTKHFAVNDQETNRGGVHVWLNEQAMREIYLRPFEVCIETSTFEYSDVMNGASGIMTSYNAIGTSWTSASYALCTQVLRNEWGFNGRVITDAVGTNGYMLGDTAIRAGTDMFLSAGGLSGRYTEATTGTAAGVAALRNACKNQLFVYVNSAGIGGNVTYNTAWIAIPIALTVVFFAGAVAILLLMVKPAFFPSKKIVVEKA